MLAVRGFFMQVLPKSLQFYIIGISVLAAVATWALLPTVPFESVRELVLFLTLIALAAMFPIPDPHGGFITAAGILLYVVISLYGPGAGIIVAVPGYSVGAAISRQWIPWRTLSNGAQMGLSIAAAGVAFRLSGGDLTHPDLRTLLLPLTISVLTFQLVNNLFVAVYFNRLRGIPLLSTWLADVRELLVSNLLSIPTAGLLAILYKTAGPVVLVAYLVLLPLQRRAHLLYFQQKRIYDQAIDALVLAIDANFPQGRGHSRRVANVATMLARQLDLPDKVVDDIELAALLHDVGLIGMDLPDVSDEAVELNSTVQAHARIGAELVKELPRREVARIIAHHHEKYDGTGYPDGLKGNEIPLGARVVAVAEAFDSIIRREVPRRIPGPHESALAQIKAEAGKAFDPQVVEALAAIVEAGSLDQVSLQDIGEGLSPLASRPGS